MPTTTLFAFRQALTLCLHRLVLLGAVPAINSGLTAAMTAQGIAPALIPQFDEASVVVGDLPTVSRATMCFVDSTEQNQRLASEGYFCLTLTTQIQIRVPKAGDNSPEDFRLLSSVCTDNLRDLLTSEANATITPRNPAGQLLLPPGLAFQDCYYLGAMRPNLPNREADGVTYTRATVIAHSASITYQQARAGALGS